MILHLIAAPDWAAVAGSATYSPPSLADEGFIHCTGDEELLLEVANSFYRHVPNALVLSIDEHDLTSEVRWEQPVGAPTAPQFPHVYGPINLDAVVGVRRMLRDDAGRYVGYAPDPDSD